MSWRRLLLAVAVALALGVLVILAIELTPLNLLAWLQDHTIIALVLGAVAWFLVDLIFDKLLWGSDPR